MCGRFTRDAAQVEVLKRFMATAAEGLSRENMRYNIAPTQYAPVVAVMGEKRVLMDMRWSLVASWSKDPMDTKYSTFNARDDKLVSSKLYGPSFKSKRCIVPATGFYEWKNEGGVKQPYYFHLKDGKGLFGIAGLWSRWASKTSDDVLHSYTVITTQPNGLVRDYHNRMPVMLHKEDEAAWLDPALENTDALQELLCPYPEDAMACYPVERSALRPGHDGPECTAPLETLL